MTKRQMVREIRRLVRGRTEFGDDEPAVPGRLLPVWLAALMWRRYDLVCTLDRLGYPCTPQMWGTGAPVRRDPWPLVVLTNVLYAALWTVSALIFAVVWLAVRAAEAVLPRRRQK